MKYRYIACGICFALLLTGCGKFTAFDNSSQIQTSSESVLDTSENMPAIVFLHRVSNPEPDQPSTVTFYDNSGNYYKISDEEKTSLPIDTLIKQYEAGELNDSIEFISECEVSKLESNYQKLCELSKNEDFSLKEFDDVPAVEKEVYTWYGICFNGDERKEVLIQKKDAAGEHEPNDKRATEIYEWLLSSFTNN